MKKSFALILSAVLLLLFIGCDTGTSPGDTVNPVTPAAATLETGSLVLTIAEADYSDYNTPYAVITGATSTGATFHRQVSLDAASGTGSLTVGNLLPGTWNIKIKIWDDVAGTDYVVALGYETALVAADVETDLTMDPVTQSELNVILAAVYSADPYNISDSGACGALTWGIYVLMAYDEETFLSYLSDPDEDAATVIAYISQFADATALLDELISYLAEDYSADMTYLEYLNDVLGLEYAATDYGSLLAAMLNAIDSAVIGDYEFLFYDLIDLTLTGLDYGSTLADTASVSVSSDYDGIGSYTWALNGTEVGTGSSLSLSPDDCLAGLNVLSVQYEFSGVILGAEVVMFYKDTVTEQLTVDGIDFADERVREAVLALGLTYAEDVTSLQIWIYSSGAALDLGGIEYLTNLSELAVYGYMGVMDAEQVNPVLFLASLSDFTIRYLDDQDYPLTAEAVSLLDALPAGVLDVDFLSF